MYLSGASLEEGGPTGFVDYDYSTGTPTPPSKVTYIAPPPGRIALFSGGFENVHGRKPMRSSTAEERVVVSFWFDCQTSKHGGEL